MIEHEFFIVKDYGFTSVIGVDGFTLAETVARVDTACLGDSIEASDFLNSFDVETPFCIRCESEDDEGNEVLRYVTQDRYGKELCYCSDKTKTLLLLKKLIQKEKGYNRVKLLYNMIKSIVNDNELYIVCFGY